MTKNSVGEGEVLVMSMPGEKVLERISGLRPSEKELLERHSGSFRHKIPVLICNYVSHSSLN
jgi:hypothetical protein